MKRVNIVGAGMAGLTAGIFLLEKGFDVSVYEKNHVAGGFVTGWVRKNIIIDGCIHWMIGSKTGTGINNLYMKNGIINKDTTYYFPKAFYRCKYDGKELNFYSDYDLLEAELKKFSEGDDERIEELMTSLRNTKDFEIPSYLPYEINPGKDLLAALRVQAKSKRFLRITLEEYANEWNSPIIRFALAHSVVNKKCTAFYFITNLSNTIEGNANVPIGGSLKMADGLINRYLSLGGKLYLDSPCDEIIVVDGKATGIRVKGEVINSDYVIAACDVRYSLTHLLKLDLGAYKDLDNNDKLNTYSFVISAFKTNIDLSNEEVYTVLKIKEFSFLNRVINRVAIRHYAYDKSLMNGDYACVQVIIDTTGADYEIIKAMSKEEYKSFKDDVGRRINEVINEYYNSKLELIDVITPHTFERYNNSFEGTFMTYPTTPFIDHRMRSQLIDEVENVILANQWILMPGGTCVAATLGKFAAQLIMKKENIEL